MKPGKYAMVTNECGALDVIDVWHWFDERCPNGVAEDLMYNTEK